MKGPPRLGILNREVPPRKRIHSRVCWEERGGDTDLVTAWSGSEPTGGWMRCLIRSED